MITVLSGGTGTPKLLQGLKQLIPEDELTIIVNTLENNYFSGVYIAADIDTVMYTMADKINDEFWYGQKDDTFHTHNELEKLGYHETLKIGDRDRAVKIQKTELMKTYSLQEAVKIQKDAMKIKANILPMSNEQSHVTIKTDIGDMSFHDFLITHQSQPQVLDVIYKPVKPARGVINAIKNSEMVIIGPSNPVTSINPIVNMKGVKEALMKVNVCAVSPFIGDMPISGPAEKFMKAWGYLSNPEGVAQMYEEFLNHYIINTTDNKYKTSIEEKIPKVSLDNIILKTMEDKLNLSKNIILNVDI